MDLIDINKENIDSLLKQHDSGGLNLMNESLMKLFSTMSDETNEYEVSIKVAALNHIYSTGIQYIKPIVNKILSNVPKEHKNLSEQSYIDLVDKISTVQWVSETSGKEHKRCNLSFSSKYIHFLSGTTTPIYDSYIWLVMVAYLRKKNKIVSTASPICYKEFHELFINFKELYQLEYYSNYEIDKFLWQYGKNILTGIRKTESVNLNKAKSIFKKCITSQ